MFRLSLCCSVSLLTVGCIEQHINPFPNESDPAVTCDVVPNASSDVEINGECDTPLLHLEDPWDVAVEWQWQGSAADPDVANVISTPVIVHLTDDNLDGRIDSSDIPDIAFVAYDSWMSAGVLVAVDGASGQTLWRSEPGLYAPSGLAAGDVDGDGVSELLGYFVEGFINVRVIAFDHDGQAMWLSEDTLPIVGTTVGSIGNPFPLLTVADLEGDESMEVIMDRLVLDGRDGSTKFALNLEDGDTIRTVSTADMDLDGEREIILGNSVFGADGALLWTAPLQTIEGLAVAWNAVVDVDEDARDNLYWQYLSRWLDMCHRECTIDQDCGDSGG